MWKSIFLISRYYLFVIIKKSYACQKTAGSWVFCAEPSRLECYFELNVLEPKQKLGGWYWSNSLGFPRVCVDLVNSIISDRPCWNIRTLLRCCLGSSKLGLHWNIMFLLSLTKKQLVELYLKLLFGVFNWETVLNLTFPLEPLHYNAQCKFNSSRIIGKIFVK